MRVSEVMRINPVCCSRTTSVLNAARMFREFDIGFLPVVDELSAHRLIGVVTDRDICLEVLGEEHDPTLTTVEDCMATDLVTCTPENDIRELAAVMAQHQVRRIPIVDRENNLRGLIGVCDLIEHNALPDADICRLLGKIMAPKVRSYAEAA